MHSGIFEGGSRQEAVRGTLVGKQSLSRIGAWSVVESGARDPNSKSKLIGSHSGSCAQPLSGTVTAGMHCETICDNSTCRVWSQDLVCRLKSQ